MNHEFPSFIPFPITSIGCPGEQVTLLSKVAAPNQPFSRRYLASNSRVWSIRLISFSVCTEEFEEITNKVHQRVWESEEQLEKYPN